MQSIIKRKDGEEQPYISLFRGFFRLRLPFIHWEWEFPEMIQAIVVFMTGAAATAYLQDMFGFSFELALSIVIVHEALYLVNNLLGDAMIGGWITAAIPLIIAFLSTYQGEDRIYALISIELWLAFLYLALGITGLAEKLINWCPTSIKAGILFGAGFAACTGKYGFMSVANGGLGFYKHPLSWTIGVLLSLFLLFSYGFGEIKFKTNNKFIKLLAKGGFLPALVIGGMVGMLVHEIPFPDFSTVHSFLFNPIPGWIWSVQNYSALGVGLPPVHILLSAFPLAFIAYVIAFGDLIGGTAFLKDTRRYRTDEIMSVNPNRTNVCCGIRNLVEYLVAPTCTMSGPMWPAMTVTVAERYKTGKENMYSIFGGSCTFNTCKVLCCLIVPLMALVKPVLPLAMTITMMIAAFGSFYVGLKMCRTNIERGIAGITGGAIAISANPAYGLLMGALLFMCCELFFTRKSDRMQEVVKGFELTIEESQEAKNEISSQLDKMNQKKERVSSIR